MCPERVSYARMPTNNHAAAAKEDAAHAGLRYVSDLTPGIRRTKKGSGFSYMGTDKKAVKDEATLKRISSLVIPPAWTDVWICTSPNGHLQATGRDAKGRKQSRYHPKWRAFRDRTKYDKLLSFGEHLPTIRARVKKDLAQSGLSREKVLAAIIRILDVKHLRVGNEEYAQENHSYGLTTLRNKHADVHGSSVRFRFTGKSGQKQDVEFHDARIARIIKKCEELPGHELFAYVDDNGNAIDIGSQDVNNYLRDVTDEDITAKDFRTWGGTIEAAACLLKAGECDTKLKEKKCMNEAVKEVAKVLGNRPATSKKYYIDPRIFSAYTSHSLCGDLAKELTKNSKSSKNTLQPIEHAVLKVLKTMTKD